MHIKSKLTLILYYITVMYRRVLVVYILHDAHHTIRSSMKMKLAPVHELGDTAFVAFYTIRHAFSSEVVFHSMCPTKL